MLVLLYAAQGTHMFTAAVLALAAVLVVTAILVDTAVLFGPEPERAADPLSRPRPSRHPPG